MVPHAEPTPPSKPLMPLLMMQELKLPQLLLLLLPVQDAPLKPIAPLKTTSPAPNSPVLVLVPSVMTAHQLKPTLDVLLDTDAVPSPPSKPMTPPPHQLKPSLLETDASPKLTAAMKELMRCHATRSLTRCR